MSVSPALAKRHFYAALPDTAREVMSGRLYGYSFEVSVVYVKPISERTATYFTRCGSPQWYGPFDCLEAAFVDVQETVDTLERRADAEYIPQEFTE